MPYFIFLFVQKIVFALSAVIYPLNSLPPGIQIITHPVVPLIAEASGIADSKTHPKHLWVHEDSGNKNQLYLITHTGQVKRRVYLKGIKNRDWEEMALVWNEIFIADTGDNLRRYINYSFYRFPEPKPSQDTITTINRIRFKYPNTSHDAEAFLVDPRTEDIYILTKRDTLSLIYQIKAPYSLTKTNLAILVGKLKYTGVVGAALSPDGKQILVKTYTNIYSYSRLPNENIATALQKPYRELPYQIEPQGEAISFALDNSGYFTLSEKRFSPLVNLYFYPQK